MAKIKYNKTTGIKKILEKSKPIDSVGGEEYESLYPSVFKEIQKKNSEYDVIARNAANIILGNDSGSDRLVPGIPKEIISIEETCKRENIKTEVSGIKIIFDIVPICLSIDNNSVDNNRGPEAQKIYINNRKSVSIKPSNIVFHPAQLMGVLADMLVFGHRITEADLLEVIVNVLKALYLTFSCCSVEIDECCAKILRTLYDTHIAIGIEEEELIESTRKKYSKLQREEIVSGINKLYELGCVELLDGKVYLRESIRLQ